MIEYLKQELLKLQNNKKDINADLSEKYEREKEKYEK